MDIPATSDNIPGTLVLRDASGNLSAGTVTGNVTGNLTGNASTATSLQTSRTIELTGDVTGSASFNGTANASITASIGTGAIVNADVNASAAIALSKLATGALPTAITVATDNIVDANITTAKINDAAVTFAKQQSPQYTGFRNAIINGNFDIWQRGTSATGAANDQYVADRWYTSRAGSTVNVTREAFTAGQTDVPNEPTYFHRSAVTSVAGAGNNAALSQRIEDVRTFAGQNVTVSFYAKADAAKPISVELWQAFGSGGSPSSSVFFSTTKTTLSTSWQKITVTAAIPSISGKTIGSDNNSRLVLSIWFDAGSNFNSRTDTLGQQSGTFDIAQVQIEAGSVATPFERRPIGTELALCQRYYTKSYSLNTAPATATYVGAVQQFGFNTSTFHFIATRFPTTMRSAPSVTLYTPDNGTSGEVRRGSSNVAGFALDINDSGFRGGDQSTATNSDFTGFHYVASAEL